jgi:hypothetical protein
MFGFIKRLFEEFNVLEEDIRLAEAKFRSEVTDSGEYITNAFAAGAHWALGIENRLHSDGDDLPADGEQEAPKADVPAAVETEVVPDAPAAEAAPSSTDPAA